MKKFLSLAFCMFVIIGCSGNKEEKKPITFYDIAKQEMKDVIDRRLPHDEKDTPRISNLKDIINVDSAYACVFEMAFKNKYNGWSRAGFTYVIVQTDDGKKVCLYDRIDEYLHYAELEGEYSNDYEKALNYCNFFLMKDYVETIE